jgi:hypothetical protein
MDFEPSRNPGPEIVPARQRKSNAGRIFGVSPRHGDPE